MDSVAFFDLDGTLLAVNSARLWILRERRLERIGRRDLARGIAWAAAYRLGLSAITSAIEDAVATLEGRVPQDLQAETWTFWREELDRQIRPGAREALSRHRAAGDRVVLLTSSTPFAARCAQEALGLEDRLSMRLEERDGRLTGRVIPPLCYAEGKLEIALRWLERAGTDLEHATFYTDSFADLPVLERVGRPVCVCPDPRLARAARRRGWAVEDWGRPVAGEGAGGER